LSRQYQLTEENANKVALSPNEVLPQLAAELHANIMEQALSQLVRTMQETLPQMIEQIVEQRTATSRAEDTFFSQWPELREHRQAVMEIGRLYKAQNPKATLEEFTQNVGMHVWMAKRLPVAKLAERINGAQAQAPRAPAQPSPPPGYAPAAPAQRAQPPAPAQSSNPWGDFAIAMKETFY
jgi:hypothetical protein